MSKVVRLPDTLADFLKKYPSTIGELVNQIEAGLLSLNVDVTALQGVTATNTVLTDILARLDLIENTVFNKVTDTVISTVADTVTDTVTSEAVAPANFTQALLQKAKEVAPLKLMQAA
jgi:uracil DNA glycosylase